MVTKSVCLGKGDKKTRMGKIIKESNEVRRPKKSKKER